jgi:hypothetical protein
METYELAWSVASNGENTLMRLQTVDYEAILLDLPMSGASASSSAIESAE